MISFRIFGILLLCISIFNISFANIKLNGNLKYRCDCFPQLNGYFERFKGYDKNTNEPIFYGKIYKEDIKDHNHYFKKYTFLDKNNQKKKIAFRYSYYKNQSKMGDYYFAYQQTKKVILKKAIWYNTNGNIIQYNIYRIKSYGNTNKYENIFRYYNNFGVLIRKIIYTYENDILMDTENVTDFTPEEQVLGEQEY